jgi:O-antigen/teichoic acid export membrane protein
MSLDQRQPSSAERVLFRRSLAGGISARVLQLALLVSLGVTLTASEFGRYSAAYTTIFAAAAAVSGALGVAVNTTVAGRRESRIAARAWCTVVLVSVGVALVAASVGSLLLRELTDGAVTAPRLVLAGAGLVVLNDAQLSMLAGLSRSLPLAYLELARGALTLALGLAGAVADGAAGALVAFVAGEAVTAVLASAVVWAGIRGLDEPTAAEPAMRGSLGSTALLGFVSGAMMQVGLWLGQLWALEGTSAASFAVLAMALRLTNMIVVLPGMLSRNYLARLKSVAAEPGAWRAELRTFLRRVAALGLMGALAVIVLTALLPIVLGDGYQQLPWISVLLAVGMLMSAASSALGIALLTLGRRGAWFVSDVLLAVLLVAGMWLFKSDADARWVFAGAFVVANLTNVAVRLPQVLARGGMTA